MPLLPARGRGEPPGGAFLSPLDGCREGGRGEAGGRCRPAGTPGSRASVWQDEGSQPAPWEEEEHGRGVTVGARPQPGAGERGPGAGAGGGAGGGGAGGAVPGGPPDHLNFLFPSRQLLS